MNNIASQVFCASLNHLLHQQDWARERLAKHASSHLRVQAPAPLPVLSFRITESGITQAADIATEPQLRIVLHAQALPLLLGRKQDSLKHIELSGNADLAAAVQEIFLKLEWDVEEDLSRVFGDVMAHRMTRTAQDFLTWQREAVERGSRNIAEYLSEERRLLSTPVEAAAFADAVGQLRDRVDYLSARIDALSTRIKNPG